jgi:hypothetical protein
LNYSGTDFFSYTIADTNGVTSSATVTVNVNPRTNNPPTIAENNISVTTAYGTTVTIDVKAQANASDPDGDPLTITLNQPLNGTVELSGDQVVYTPHTGFSGTDTFTYRVSDEELVSDEATVTVTVTPKPNGSPEAIGGSVSEIKTEKNKPVTIDVVSNYIDPDGDQLTVSNVGNPSHGQVTVNSDNTVTYTPSSSYVGNDSFTYTISDGKGGTATASVNVTVNSTTTNNTTNNITQYAD